MQQKSAEFNGRIALVTGASRGIGAAVAQELAARGAHVVLLARTQGALEEIDDAITAIGGKATLVPMDLTKFQDIDTLGASLFERFGKLDMFVNAAATLGILTPAHHLELKDLERAMRLNFTATTRLIRSLDPLLRASDAGRSVFLSSDVAVNPLAYYGAFAASKAAMEAFVRAYAAEIVQTQIKANLVRLPPVQTALLDKAFPGGYPGTALSPETVAPFIADALCPSFSQNGQALIYKA